MIDSFRDAPAAPLTPPEYAPTETREVLIATALDELHKHGPSKLSLNGLLRRSGISKGSFFHHFSGMQDLLLGCYEFLEDRFNPLPDPRAQASLPEFLEQLGRDVADRRCLCRYFTLVNDLAELARDQPALAAAQARLLRRFKGDLVGRLKSYAPHAAGERLTDVALAVTFGLASLARERILFGEDLGAFRLWCRYVQDVSMWLAEEPGDAGARSPACDRCSFN